jgi:hypothetical protein
LVTTEREEMASAAACMKDTPLYMSCMGGEEKRRVVSGEEKSGVEEKGEKGKR